MRLDIDLVLRNESGNEIHTEELISIHMNRKITRNEFEEDWDEQIKKQIKKGVMSLIKKANSQNQSSATCPKCQSKMIIEIHTEFEVEETGEETGLLPAYECHDCKHIWPKILKEE